MKTCYECGKKTNSYYLARSDYYRFLCGDCAKEHGYSEIEKLNKEINELKANINNIRNDVNEAIYSDCKHQYEDTGYCQVINGNAKVIYRCSSCGLEKLGEWNEAEKEAIL